MKLQKLRYQINISLASTLILAIIFIASVIYIFISKENQANLITQIQNRTSSIIGETSELEGTINETKKYKEIWKNLDSKKKSTEGIKIDQINSAFDQIAEEYNIYNQNIKISLPEAVKGGIFERKTLDIFYSKVDISFFAADDRKAVLFITNFLKKMPGYIVVTDFSLKQSKESYDREALVEISSGKNAAFIIEAKISFFSYIFKEKTKSI